MNIFMWVSIIVLLLIFVCLGICQFTKNDKLYCTSRISQLILTLLLMVCVAFGFFSSIRYCTNCGYGGTINVYYCGECGSRTATNKELRQTMPVCPNCNKRVAQKHCIHCGWESTVDEIVCK